MPVIDPNDPQYQSTPGLPAGRHVVFIAEIEIGASKAKGTPFVLPTFECHDPESEYRGKQLKFQHFYITPKIMWRFVALLNAARPDGCPPIDTDDIGQLERELLDRSLVIEVVENTETYQGKTRTKREIDDLFPLAASEQARLVEAYGPTMVPPLDEDDGDLPPLGNEAPQDRGGEFSDDEIPFAAIPGWI